MESHEDGSHPPWASLPTLALEAIFRHLNVVQLTRMRLMCRQWNTAICHSSALMRKFVPHFPGQTVLEMANLEDQQKMADAVTARFSEAFVDIRNIAMLAGPLWFRLGETLRILHVSGYSGTFAATDLVEGLRALPKLVELQLRISSSEVDFEVNRNFKLEQLETLALYVDDVRYVDLFSKICSGLKVFKYYHQYKVQILPSEEETCESPTADEIMPIVLENRHSLQKISVDGGLNCGKLLKQISSVDRLQLKALEIRRRLFETFDFIYLGQVFPIIEELKIDHVDSKELDDIYASFKQLRSLSVHLFQEDADYDNLETFLGKMPQLEHLSVHFDLGSAYPRFRALRECHNLRSLTFRHLYFPDSLLSKCPNIRSLTLTEFEMTDMRDGLLCLSKLNSLEFLEYMPDLFNVHRDHQNHDEVQRFGIKLKSVRFLRTNVISLALCCPNLETADFSYQPMERFDVCRMLRRLPKLTDLVVDDSSCIDTNAALYAIATYGRHLQKVHLHLPERETSESVRDEVKKSFENIADVQIKLNPYSSPNRWREEILEMYNESSLREVLWLDLN